MKQQQIPITKDGYEALKKELVELVEKKRPDLVDRLERSRSEGDITENSAYADTKDELEFLDGRIDELRHVIENAKVLQEKKNGGQVELGAEVLLRAGKADRTFHIVGEWEADPMKQKISHSSPLGKALCGKRVGDKVEVEAPAGKIVYEILEIK